MISTRNTGSNYLAKVVVLKNLRKHSNADRLQCVSIDFNNVITDLTAADGDVYVYFPVGTKIHQGYLSATDSYSDPEMNNNKEKKGYFSSKGVVKATRLRQEKSCGYIVPAKDLGSFFEMPDLDKYVGQEFDCINDNLVCEKYVTPHQKGKGLNKQRQAVKISRLVEGQFRFHEDTDNLRRNVHKIKPEDTISIHYKKHGTSWVVGHILVKRRLNVLEKLLVMLGVKINLYEYDYVYSSRKVIKNGYLNAQSQHFYDYDLWEDIKDRVKDFIPKGFCLMGEAVGYLKTGRAIQPGYDYGCGQEEMKIFVYRITQTNPDGLKIELSDNQIKEFCDRTGLNFSETYLFNGKAKEITPVVPMFKGMPELPPEEWEQRFIKDLEEKYNEKDCYMCVNKVPEEGIVIRLENSLFDYNAFKLKSFRFLEHESAAIEKGQEDIEETQTTEEE